MAARRLMPELLQPPNSPQYTYAALALKYLPAGLMGLMIAAMFSATMSTLSGDYNVMAERHDRETSIVDREPAGERTSACARRSHRDGARRWADDSHRDALVETARKGLFEVMVTVFGLFVGPMLLPMLAGLLNRRVDMAWRGGGYRRRIRFRNLALPREDFVG